VLVTLACLLPLPLFAQNEPEHQDRAAESGVSDEIIKFEGRWISAAERDAIIAQRERLSKVCSALKMSGQNCGVSGLDAARQAARGENPLRASLIEGLRAYVDGDYDVTCSKLKRYLESLPDDETALRFFALGCREKAKELEQGARRLEAAGKAADAGQARRQANGYLVDAENTLGKRTRLFPDAPEPLNDFGEFLLDGNRIEDAYNCFERAALRDPHYVPARLNLARLYLSAGMPLAADRELQAVAKESSENVEVHELQARVRAAVDDYEREEERRLESARKAELGLQKYHGRWMKPEEKAAHVELEIVHVQALLDESNDLSRTSSVEGISYLFHQTQQFLEQFTADDSLDVHIEEKTLLLLASLHVQADGLKKTMRQELDDPKDLMDFPLRLQRLERFSSEVCLPLMQLLAPRMLAYVSRNGKDKFIHLMSDNNLGAILNDPELLHHLD
jgi:tetratricopeptide (TPR) repeat protein